MAAVELGHARVMLADGGVLEVADDGEVYEELWRIAAEQRGAASAATKLLHARTFASNLDPRPFDSIESEALRAAIRHLEARRAG